jgi:uncharacterized protein (TIGR04222 family)
MNPFDLPGPQFLVVYLLLACAVIVITAVLGNTLPIARAGDPRLLDWLTESPYRLAALRDGSKAVVETALARLLAGGLLKMTGVTLFPGDPPPRGLADVEVGLLAAVGTGTAARSMLFSTAQALGEPYQRSVEQMGLRIHPDRWFGRAVVLGLPLWATIAFGAVKIGVGVLREKPVVLLVLLVVATALAGVAALYFTVSHSTGHGRWARAELEKQLDAARYTAVTANTMLPGSEAALAIGLFGLAELGLHQELQSALGPPPAASGGGGSSGGCGSSCSSGGCGGGGCGGGGCGGCS